MDILTASWGAILLGPTLVALWVARRTSSLLILLCCVTPFIVAIAYWALEECFAGINTSETCTWGFVLLPLYVFIASAVGASLYLIWMSVVWVCRRVIGFNKQ